ncbi:MAG: YggS family pyridoxal phosphate-dependent enzyme [Candidatus Pseudobacter hemicellulosilyticus]|uniref:Pyridoxal phosphate homeostasis protein n=1 Tax=Candidatus Pseudobacter hemicellulosilyticus TaxID=3121375 RepID=A0AAJ5WT09_9BACT|nr:MAG: YggS family pyridoxal phosphate-dependent enzyme [Pseudobacter sp.]
MAINQIAWHQLTSTFQSQGVTLVAVSKIKPVSDIRALYELGQRDFGENYVQELADKQPQLPADLRWHFIGHLQSNKVKYIAGFVQLIHGVDSLRLLQEINKQAGKNNRTIDVLLQVHIAQEETKFGLDARELAEILSAGNLAALQHVRIRGLMGMASFTDSTDQLRQEFGNIKALFEEYRELFSGKGQAALFQEPPILSMGMSGDFALAVEAGSTMVRIGSLLFGARS